MNIIEKMTDLYTKADPRVNGHQITKAADWMAQFEAVKAEYKAEYFKAKTRESHSEHGKALFNVLMTINSCFASMTKPNARTQDLVSAALGMSEALNSYQANLIA